MLLIALTNPAPGKNLSDTLTALCTWSRLKNLAAELEVSLPNASLLVAAINKLCGSTLAAQTMSFRVSSFRHESQVCRA